MTSQRQLKIYISSFVNELLVTASDKLSSDELPSSALKDILKEISWMPEKIILDDSKPTNPDQIPFGIVKNAMQDFWEKLDEEEKDFLFKFGIERVDNYVLSNLMVYPEIAKKIIDLIPEKKFDLVMLLKKCGKDQIDDFLDQVLKLPNPRDNIWAILFNTSDYVDIMSRFIPKIKNYDINYQPLLKIIKTREQYFCIRGKNVPSKTRLVDITLNPRLITVIPLDGIDKNKVAKICDKLFETQCDIEKIDIVLDYGIPIDFGLLKSRKLDRKPGRYDLMLKYIRNADIAIVEKNVNGLVQGDQMFVEQLIPIVVGLTERRKELSATGVLTIGYIAILLQKYMKSFLKFDKEHEKDFPKEIHSMISFLYKPNNTLFPTYQDLVILSNKFEVGNRSLRYDTFGYYDHEKLYHGDKQMIIDAIRHKVSNRYVYAIIDSLTAWLCYLKKIGYRPIRDVTKMILNYMIGDLSNIILPIRGFKRPAKNMTAIRAASYKKLK